MENRKILFTAPGKAELVSCEMPRIAPDEVLIETDYTAISAGTERANLLDMPNVTHQWPKQLGYSGSGRIVEVGAAVQDFRVGQRVLMDHLGHCAYAKARFQANGDGFYPVPEDVDPLEAAFVVVGSMGVQGARKTRLQMGEAAMVTGLGILGLFAVQSMVRMGATPLIAVDFAEDRRRVALELGADYALAPDAHFVEAVRELTEGRMIQANVEV
ncbi:MAG TPA: zinc-binding dehydrogenase, partial [Candidatus Ornithocaccomicrobium faecavium]|nr:zinc-binding dehydrogenase [Candidatus Ornithocaccomicrobium faecavium]